MHSCLMDDDEVERGFSSRNQRSEQMSSAGGCGLTISLCVAHWRCELIDSTPVSPAKVDEEDKSSKGPNSTL